MFSSSEDALCRGLAASVEEKLWWVALGAEFERQCYAALERKQFEVCSWFATQSQLCHEALTADCLIGRVSAGNG